MELYCLVVKSKSQKSINDFTSFFLASAKTLDLSFVNKYNQKRKKKKVVTILKSPHINKKAQEQFEIRHFSRQVAVFSAQSFKHIVFIKKIKDSLFPGINIQLKLLVNINYVYRLRTKILDPSNFNIKALNSKKSQLNNEPQKRLLAYSKLNFRKMGLFIRALEIYGELVKYNLLR